MRVKEIYDSHLQQARIEPAVLLYKILKISHIDNIRKSEKRIWNDKLGKLEERK